VNVAAGIKDRVVTAYNLEADRLDAHDLAAWLAWVHDEFRYEVPIPVTRDDPRAPQHSSTGFLAVETKDSVALWVSRLSPALVDAAYAENPPVRTRHFVTNVQVAKEQDHLNVTSNVLLTWGKWNEEMRFLSAQRQDVLLDDGRELTLLRRRALLDTNVIRLSHFRVII